MTACDACHLATAKVSILLQDGGVLYLCRHDWNHHRKALAAILAAYEELEDETYQHARIRPVHAHQTALEAMRRNAEA